MKKDVLRNYVRYILKEESERWQQTFTKGQSGVGGMSNIPIDQVMNTQPHLDMSFPKAACCFIQRNDGKILGVSRKYDLNAWGLPGGKLEKDESFEQAAARELYEECGLIATSLKPIFTKIDDDLYETQTFLCDIENIDDISTSEEGRVCWITWDHLLSGPFCDYNVELKKSLKQ